MPPYQYMQYTILGIHNIILWFGGKLRDHELLVKRNLHIPLDGEKCQMERNAYNELDNGVIECLVLHAARLLDKIKQLVQKSVVKHLCKAKIRERG